MVPANARASATVPKEPTPTSETGNIPRTKSERVPGGKKFCLAFLVVTVVVVCVTNGILALRATYYYAAAGFPWFEWANYLFLALFLLACPPLALCFLDSVHVRRGLRLFLFGMALSKVLEVFEGPVNHLGALWTYERPLNALYLLVEFVALVACWLLLLRQVRGKSLLPVPVRTDRRGAGSLFHNLKHFLRRPGPTDRRRLLNIALIVNCALIGGVFVTMLPENHVVHLERPAGHQMQVKFWAGDPDNYSNSTLALLAEHDVEVYCWMNARESLDWSRHNVTNYAVKDMPSGSDPAKLARWYREIDEWLDYADAHPETRQYFRGFMSDDEGLKTIARFNTSRYERKIATRQAGVAYINARGYEYGMTTVMANIGDLYDGDRDMDVVYGNPFDPVAYANMSTYNWMVYRSETAMQYDEPYEYFTYQWACHVRDYVHFVEDTHGLPRGTWLNRTGISIGVASDNMYVHSARLRGVDAAVDALIQDAKICHACEIGDATVFYLASFMESYGEEGLRRYLEEIETYQSVEFRYKRRATYFGNLKWASNVNGSVFGLFFCDGLYDAGFGWVALVAILALLVLPAVLGSLVPWERWGVVGPTLLGKAGAAGKINAVGKPGGTDEARRLAERQTEHGAPATATSPGLTPGETGIRAAFFVLLGLVLVWTFLVAEIFVFSKEIFLWGPYYWQEVALEEPWFIEFWADFTRVYVYLLVAVLVGLALAGAGVRRWLDRRIAPPETK